MTPRGGRRKAEPPANARLYWNKATRFARSAQRNAEAEDWDPAVSSAIHALINVVDAVCVHYQGERNASDNHDEALAILGNVTELDPRIRESLRRHLGAVLAKKGAAEYESRLLERGEAEACLAHLRRAIQSVLPLARRLGWEPR